MFCYYGEIANAWMHLSEIGKIAEEEWFKTVELRPDMNLKLDEFVVMPNHIHGIIYIGKNEYNCPRRDAMLGVFDEHCVSDEYRIPDEITHNHPKNKFAPQSKNLASIIRGYKSAVTTYARKNNIPFCWQSRCYDHIIRSYREYCTISDYIQNNPARWDSDKFFK
jgi:REP element-mobilizing transposase RayT